ncbi:hypothetical protein C8R41DRAFT_977247 [Lentinula lateritia]|uniref:Uncharacterized protein n=1 Tax=Lentinula lateritia TaxID=40482 RepID=A0ABQ8VXM9_9AGAR|nr:hypothetical protein C8R41DRAFT_977247 [Lentinula lateritia]
MAITENALPASPLERSSVSHIDLSKTFNTTGTKKNRNQNSTPSSSSRKPMGNLNRLSGHAKPLGLLSPPSSQINVLSGEPDSERNSDRHSDYEPREKDEDPARLLISPPPEEELQQINISQRSSFHKPSTSHLNDSTKSIPTSSIAPSHSKRKRSMAATHSFVGSSYTTIHNGDFATDAQATPNPKPRKQSRKFNRAHVRTVSNQSDTSIQTTPSPTQGSRIATSTLTEQELLPLPSSLTGHSVQATPSRKRRQSKLMRSPHTFNPNADYIPPFRTDSDEESINVENDQLRWPYTKKAVRIGRRSVTPATIPPYEPPPVVFTPPREVVHSPVTSTTKSKRKVGKSKGLRLDLHIKSEPPDIDYLNAPMPPPSPTDDPLLLSGPPEGSCTPSRSRTMRNASVSADFAQNIRKQPSFALEEESLPPSSPPAQEDSSSPSQATYHWPNTGVVQEDDRSTDSMELDMQPHEYAEMEGIPYFGFGLEGFAVASAGAWSDSDEEGPPHTPVRETGVIDEGIGEFTGHWRMTQVPTKADPPSSTTRTRMDDWGRPKSPYPYRRPSSSSSIPRVGSTSPSPSHPKSRVDPSATAEVEKADRSVPLADEDHTITLHPPLTELSKAQEAEARSYHEHKNIEDAEEQEEQEVRALSISPDDEGEDSADEEEVRRLSLGPEQQFEEKDSDSEQEESEVEDLDFSGASFGMMAGDNIAEPSGVAATAHTPRRVHSAESQAWSSPAPLRDLAFLSDKRRGNARLSALERAKELFGTRSSPVKPLSGLARIFDDDEQDAEAAHSSHQASERPITVDEVFEEEEEELKMDAAEDAAEMSSGDESDPMSQDPGLVQITSSDPKAAARAAAILKQHDYDCFTKIVLRQQQQHTREISHYTIEKLKRDSRRKTLSGAGISKGKPRSTPRRSLGTVVGDMVYIPGSPVTTLGGLLKEAEKEVQEEQFRGVSPRISKSGSPMPENNALVGMGLGERAPYRTPLPAKYGLAIRPRSTLVHEIEVVDVEDDHQNDQQLGYKEWTKEEWRILDACFTDERIDLASRSSSNSNSSPLNDGHEDVLLAEVDFVDVDVVVQRFIVEMGGDDITNARGWSRDSLRARAKAIQKKQRAGHVAPPTTPYTPRTMSREPSSSMEVPDFTPLNRRPFPLRNPILLPPPGGSTAPFSSIPEDIVEEPRRHKVPSTLLAPRYSHLLHEAVAISRELASEEPSLTNSKMETLSHLSFGDPTVKTSSLPKAGLGRLFSYIPGFLKPPASNRKAHDSKPGLPLPPAEIIDKHRGPIVTPARPPAPKSKPPKELVNLHHQPVPDKKEKSKIPRKIPQRMVQLNQVGLPKERQESTVRPRRSSGGSVKDLIKTFESFDDNAHHTASVRNIGNWKKGLPGSEKSCGKPLWKP